MSTLNSSANAGNKSAPLGVKIICILGVIVSIFTFFMSLRIFAAGGPFVSLGLLFIFLTFAYLVVLYGLWTVQSWGWTWGMIVFVFGAITNLFELNIVGLIFSFVIIGYLYSKRGYYRS